MVHALGGAPAAPYVDVLKLCGVTSDKWPRGNFARAGGVCLEVDRAVGRPVVRLAGAVPAANSLRLPRAGVDSLELLGRFMYIQAQLIVSKPYAICVELVTADKSLHRLTISNLCKQDDLRMRRSGIHVYMPAEEDSWSIIALDMQALAQQGCKAAFSHVKSIQLCANMTVRTVFSSTLKYSWESLPRDLSFTASFYTGTARMVWMPEEPTRDVQLPAAKQRPPPPLPAVPRQAASHKGKSCEDHPPGGRPTTSEEGEALGTMGLEPNPIMQLQHMSTFTGEFHRAVLWANGEMLFPAGNVIVAMQAGGSGSGGSSCGGQRHLLGHSRPVVAMAVDSAASMLASAQEGSTPAIRLWDLACGTCLAVVDGHVGSTISLDISPDGNRLVSAGVDSHGKQVVVLCDISQCRAGGKAIELARQVSDHNLKCIKFLPFEPDKMVACGKNCIRIFRVKDGQLRGVSIPMDNVQALRKPYSCGTLADPACATVGEVFTDIAFEHNPQLLPVATRRAYVTTLSGALFQVNIDIRAVEAVYQLHDAAINTVALRHGFCITGCGKGMLCVWSLDFGEAYMEVQLEGSVTGVAVSEDGLSIACGTEIGMLGVVSITSHKFATLLRSHTGEVHAVAVEPSGQQFYSASADGTVRTWDSATKQQLLEFFVPGDKVLCIACHPTKGEVACGFGSGAVRVFDVAAAALTQECEQHTGPVRQVLYASRGHILLSAGEDGTVCAFDARRAYLPLRYLGLEPGLAATCIAVSPNSQKIAVATQAGGNSSRAQASVTFYTAASLDPALQFPLPSSSAPSVTHLHFLPDAQQLVSITADGRLLAHSCHDGALTACVPGLHGTSGPCMASALDKSGAFLVTGGADGLVKVWGLHALHQLAAQQQREQAQALRAAWPDAPAGGKDQAAAEGAGGSTRGLVKALPCQAFRCHGGAVLSLTFLGSGEVLSAGAQDSLCSWAFLGQPCGAYLRAPCDATAGTIAIVPLSPAKPLNLAAAPHQEPAMLRLAKHSDLGQGQQEEQLPPPQQQQHEPPPDKGIERPRRVSWQAPPGVAKRAGTASCTSSTSQAAAAAAAAAAASPRAGPRAVPPPPPLQKAEPPGPHRLRVAAGAARPRGAQPVPLQRDLHITAPACGATGSKAPAAAGRRAAWVWRERAEPPAYRPEEQLQLMPPAAAVRHVYGFSAEAGFGFGPEGQVAFAAGNVLVLDGLEQQRQIAFHAGSITAMASSAAGSTGSSWLAAAVEPKEAAAADIHVYDAASGQQRCTLQCHHAAVRQLWASPDGRLLVSVGSGPEAPLALWDMVGGELIAAVEGADCCPLPDSRALAWVPAAQQPSFFAACAAGLCHWALGPAALGAEQVLLPEAMRGAAVQAVACCGQQRADGSCLLMLGDSCGCVWAVEVSAALEVSTFALLAELQEQSITALHACEGLVAAGTADGMVAVMRQARGTWELAGCHQLDGRLSLLKPCQDGSGLVAATEAPTLWVLQDAAAEVLPSSRQDSQASSHSSATQRGWNSCPAGLAKLLSAAPPPFKLPKASAVRCAHPAAVAASAAHAGHVYCVYAPTDRPATIQLHDCSGVRPSLVKTIPVVTSGAITALAASPGDKLLAAGGAGGTVLLLRGDTEAWTELAGHASQPVEALAFSLCGTKLYSMAGGVVFVWGIEP